MQFHNQQQPRFITLGDRLVDIYGIVDILPFQMDSSGRGNTSLICHKINLITGEWLSIFDDEDKRTIETILARQGVDVQSLREETYKSCYNRKHSLA